MQVLCAVLCLLTLGALLTLALTVVRNGGSRSVPRGPGAWAVALALGLLWVALLFRPHAHVFQGLDASAYRLMARAFAEGRPACAVDDGLRKLPTDVREWVMYWPNSPERRTRDRSFEVLDMQGCETRPFFYPFLPYCMVGLDVLVPSNAADFFVPVVGAAFSLCLLAAAAQWGGAWGAILAAVFLLGTPLPAWLFRGCFAESVSAALLGTVALHGIAAERRSAWIDAVACLLIGLSVSFHPAMVLPAVFLQSFFTIGARKLSQGLGLLAAFFAGLLPVLVISLTVTSPYGPLRWDTLGEVATGSGSIALLAVFVLGALGVVGASVAVGPSVRNWVAKGRRAVVLRALLPAAWVLPTWAALQHHGVGFLVRRGLVEAWSATQWTYAAVLAVALVAALLAHGRARERALLTAVFFVLPVFLYLKGAERMQLWSMRRLIVPLVLCIVAILPCLCQCLAPRGKRWRQVTVTAVGLALVALCLVNPVRWPAPYTVRYDRGGDRLLQDVLDRTGRDTLVFDYFPYSVPFAVLEGRRVYGLTEYSWCARDYGLPWFCSVAQTGAVTFVSAYANPGIEDGLILQEQETMTLSLPRVKSKAALPALYSSKELTLRFLRAVPVSPSSKAPVLDKVFDGARRKAIPNGFGVRGPWGRSDIALETPTGPVRAQWTREGSAVIGPVPAPGKSVEVFVVAAACRSDGVEGQQLMIYPPWDADPLLLAVSNGYTEASGRLRMPEGTDRFDRTGRYKLAARAPYDPSGAGIQGFRSDLGVLLHRIRIRPVPAP